LVKTVGIPEYLKRGWGESRWRRVMRYRLGNEMRKNLYWEGEGQEIVQSMWIRGGDMGACMGEMQGLEIGGGELARSSRTDVGREGGGRGRPWEEK